MLRVFERSTLVNVLNVSGGDPVGRGDFTEGFDPRVFFAEALKTIDEPFDVTIVKVRFGFGLGNVPVVLSPHLQETQIVKRESFEDELVNGGGIAFFVEFERDNDLLSTKRDFPRSVIDARLF